MNEYVIFLFFFLISVYDFQISFQFFVKNIEPLISVPNVSLDFFFFFVFFCIYKWFDVLTTKLYKNLIKKKNARMTIKRKKASRINDKVLLIFEHNISPDM